MRVKQLWVIAVGLGLLLSAPAWAHSKGGESAGGKEKNERRDSSILLKTTKRAEHSVLSEKLGQTHPGVANALSKQDDRDEKASKSQSSKSQSHASVGGLPPGLQKKLGEIRWFGNSAGGDRGLSTSTPAVASTSAVAAVVAAAVPIPEPSALLLFGVGLVVARRTIGRTWR